MEKLILVLIVVILAVGLFVVAVKSDEPGVDMAEATIDFASDGVLSILCMAGLTVLVAGGLFLIFGRRL